ncbi:MAG: N-acetylneuraminate synthase family protein [bacterium]|nr:N-acetylneuraminate synthase family protein [bacterium]
MPEVLIGGRLVGDSHPCFVVAEIGINHNGDVDIARKLIDLAADAGCDAVKFQKRTIDVVYSPEELAVPREHPFGTTNGDLKRHLEFGFDDYAQIDIFSKERGILWFASPWDEGSVDFLESFRPPCYKVASASLTDDNLLRHVRSKGRPVILSTGMSTMAEVEHAVEVLGSDDLVLLHAVSMYPAEDADLNLLAIRTLKERFLRVPVGYSGHERGVHPSIAALVLGACVVERHITLDFAMFGSDQPASLQPEGLKRLVRDIRAVESAMGDGKKTLHPKEIPIKKKLRRVAQAV